MKKLVFAIIIVALFACAALPCLAASTLEDNLATIESYIKNPKSVSKDNALHALDWVRDYVGSSGSTFVVNTGTEKFHRPSCRYAKQIQGDNRQEFIGAREELIKRGYAPCKVCNP